MTVKDGTPGNDITSSRGKGLTYEILKRGKRIKGRALEKRGKTTFKTTVVRCVRLTFRYPHFHVKMTSLAMNHIKVQRYFF